MGPSERPLPLGFDWPNKRVPVVFIDVAPSPSSSSSSFYSAPALDSTLSPPLRSIVQFESYSSSNASKSKSFSYSNLAEAEVLCGVVQGLLDKGTLLSQVESESLSLSVSQSLLPSMSLSHLQSL